MSIPTHNFKVEEKHLIKHVFEVLITQNSKFDLWL